MAENNKHVVSHIDFNGDSIDIQDAVAREAASDAAKAVSELTKNVVTDIAQGISDYTIRVTKNGLAIDVPIKGLSSKLDELTEAIGGSGGSGGNISLDSHEFTGIPKAPTAASGSDTTQIANTKFVQSELAARSTAQQSAIKAAYENATKYTDEKVADLIGSAPETMDTLEEVAAAINDIQIGGSNLIPNIASNWQQGNWDEFSGNYLNSNARICTKVGLKVSPRETYSIQIYLNGVTGKHLLFRTYGSDGSFIGSVVGITKLIYTVPSNVYELRFVAYEYVTLDDLTNGAVRVNVEKVDNSIIDLSMLGWSVPEDCPIQNEVNGTQFIQKVGRVDIGTLQMTKQFDPTRYMYRCSVPNIKPESSRDTAINGYCYGWTAVSRAMHWEDSMFSYYANSSVSDVVFITTTYTDVDTFKQVMKGQYLYYELATPITTTIDGNEIGETVSDVRKETTVNLLPASSSESKKGVTFTGNGDGTYTLTGTATDDVQFLIAGNIIKEQLSDKLPLKLLGGISNNVYVEYKNTFDDSKSITDKGTGGAIINNANNSLICVTVLAGETLPNVVVKPMLTTNLDATYDDFVPYTGNSGSLNGDVANINTKLDKKADKTKYGDTVVSVGRKPDSTVGDNSFAFGNDTTASGAISHAEGLYTTASGNFSHAEGNSNTASGYASHAEGYNTTALDNQHAQGHFNNTTTATDNSLVGTSTGTAFVIGNGTNSSLSNAFRVTGNGYVYATNATVQTGADYAEYFEWSDGNPDNEDRVGLFVTFDENNQEKIRIANSNDDYILGIVSGMPSVIGNGDEDWKKRYVLDDFGRYIQETFEYVIDGETKTGTKWKENPEYDSTKTYTSRNERAEWSAIGLVGVLSVYDDGTCKVNGYCKCKNNGIATASEKGADTYRVIKRVTDNIVKVVLK